MHTISMDNIVFIITSGSPFLTYLSSLSVDKSQCARVPSTSPLRVLGVMLLLKHPLHFL